MVLLFFFIPNPPFFAGFRALFLLRSPVVISSFQSAFVYVVLLLFTSYRFLARRDSKDIYYVTCLRLWRLSAGP